MMNTNHVPHTTEAVLDLIPPDSLLAAIRYNISGFYSDDWETRHQLAGNSLCLYVFQTHGQQSKVGQAAQQLFDLINEPCTKSQ
jgi:hypothetical protein